MLQILKILLIIVALCEMAHCQNLTTITWDHAVNSQALLDKSLNNTALDMIEADIVEGSLLSDPTKQIPIMGHPPANTSDISLESFLIQVIKFNNETKLKKKGIKLDFKSTEVFNAAMVILNAQKEKLTFPVWLNADIIAGPVNNTETTPVSPDEFFAGVKNFNTSVLSIGWTTKWGSNYTVGAYTDKQIADMIEAIDRNGIKSMAITFPVRAGIAANSATQLQAMLNTVTKTNPATFTVWSSDGDYVDSTKLNDFILKTGVDKVYLDVPTELLKRLNLGNGGMRLSTNLSVVAILLVGFHLIKNLFF